MGAATSGGGVPVSPKRWWPKRFSSRNVDPVEHELRRVAQVVVPRHERLAHDDQPLAQHPLGERGVLAHRVGIDLEARDVQPARGVAADREPRAVDRELLEAQVREHQRGPRDHAGHARQLDERGAGRPRGVADAQPLHDDLGIPAVPAGDDRVDLDRMPELGGDPRRDGVALGLDVRQHEEAQREQQHARSGDRGRPGVAREADDSPHRRVRLRSEEAARSACATHDQASAPPGRHAPRAAARRA